MNAIKVTPLRILRVNDYTEVEGACVSYQRRAALSGCSPEKSTDKCICTVSYAYALDHNGLVYTKWIRDRIPRYIRPNPRAPPAS